jgi:hypothetical protein
MIKTMTETKTQWELLSEQLKRIGTKARLVSATYLAKSTGELFRTTLTVGADYDRLLENSLLAIRLEPVENAMAETGLDRATCRTAKARSIRSNRNSIRRRRQGRSNDAYTKPHVYAPSGVPNVKIHKMDLSLELSGIEIQRRTLTPGDKPRPKKGPLARAKGYFRGLTPLGDYKTLAIENIDSMRINGLKLEEIAD